MQDTPSSDSPMMHKKSIAIITILLGFSCIFSCAHTTGGPSSFSPAPDTYSIKFNAGMDRKIVQASAEDSEEDYFEEDPFDDDPFDDSESGTEEIAGIADPLAGLNRVFFHVNDKLYYWVLKPVAKGYRVVLPTKARIGVSNFFTNLLGPLRFINCTLQGKGKAADAEFVRFVMNTTVGVLGFGNPAKNYPELALNDEDFGQTFGRWGVGHGFYIVLPVLGPSSLRDSIGLLGDFFFKPVSYVEPIELGIGTWALDNINATSFRIGDYESLKKAAIDPYEAFRNAYIQYRKSQVAK